MKRRTMLLAAIAAVTGAMVLTTGASAAPQARAAKAAPATIAAAVHGLVVQRGARNYAGPNCPGKGWTCTTAKRVLQTGGENRVDCTGPGGSMVGDTQSCVVVQNGTNNSARCVERSSSDAAVQDCNITQTGNSNSAIVDQAVEANGGPTQSATQTAEVTQTGAGGNNTLSVRQHVHQHTHAAGAQVQDIHQDLFSTQTATGGGNNASDVKQDQNQDEHNGTTQAQNTTPSGSGPSCQVYFPASDPNQCANVNQTADTGDNSNHLDQSIDEDVESNAASTQSQGSFQGGINARVELLSASGRSTNDANQRKSQRAHGKNATQSQIDPMGCCSFSAQGNDQSSEHLDQSSTQEASSAFALQDLTIDGSTSSTLGTCTIVQRARNNGASSNTPVSVTPCPFLTLETHCVGASPGGEGPPTPAACTSSPIVIVPESVRRST